MARRDLRLVSAEDPSPPDDGRRHPGDDQTGCDRAERTDRLPAESPRRSHADERWICQPEGSICHDWLVRTMRTAGVEPDVAYSVTEYQTQLAMLAEGIGIGLLPRLGRGRLPEGVVAIPLLPAPTRRLYAVWRTITARRPAVAVTLEALKSSWPRHNTA